MMYVYAKLVGCGKARGFGLPQLGRWVGNGVVGTRRMVLQLVVLQMVLHGGHCLGSEDSPRVKTDTTTSSQAPCSTVSGLNQPGCCGMYYLISAGLRIFNFPLSYFTTFLVLYPDLRLALIYALLFMLILSLLYALLSTLIPALFYALLSLIPALFYTV
jgi:hypothetical protein